MRALIVGFGNLGQKIASILSRERECFPALGDLEVIPAGIITRSRGALIDPQGVDLAASLSMMERYGKFDAGSTFYSETGALEAAQRLEYDVLVEMSTLSIENHGEPAVSHIRAALERGKHVVSANKGPVAFRYSELAELAREKGCRFLFETVVMDGAPVFNLARCTLKGCTVKGIEGILNSTTNFVLTKMEQGFPMEEAVKEAQRLGIAEAEPFLDLEGWDAAAKTAVLANVLMNANITPYEVNRSGITGITEEEITSARRRGRYLKLVCRAKTENGNIKASVGVEELLENHHFSAVSGSGSILRIETDLMNPIMVTQEDPNLYDTAYGVLDDLLTLHQSIA